jgi:hypothetical protein
MTWKRIRKATANDKKAVRSGFILRKSGASKKGLTLVASGAVKN